MVKDVRGKDDEYTLDTAGFQFIVALPNTPDFWTGKKLKAGYYPECMELIKELTGATRVVPYHHCKSPTCPRTYIFIHDILAVVRCRRPGGINDNPHVPQPTMDIHVDITTAFSIARVKDLQ